MFMKLVAVRCVYALSTQLRELEHHAARPHPISKQQSEAPLPPLWYMRAASQQPRSSLSTDPPTTLHKPRLPPRCGQWSPYPASWLPLQHVRGANAAGRAFDGMRALLEPEAGVAGPARLKCAPALMALGDDAHRDRCGGDRVAGEDVDVLAIGGFVHF
jgi:hypothetical protein